MPGPYWTAFWRTRAQHIYYTTFYMEQSILIMHKYCI